MLEIEKMESKTKNVFGNVTMCLMKRNYVANEGYEGEIVKLRAFGNKCVSATLDRKKREKHAKFVRVDRSDVLLLLLMSFNTYLSAGTKKHKY